MTDDIHQRVIKKMSDKYKAGELEHGGLSQAPDDIIIWLREIQEEAIDLVFYAEKLIVGVEAKSRPSQQKQSI